MTRNQKKLLSWITPVKDLQNYSSLKWENLEIVLEVVVIDEKCGEHRHVGSTVRFTGHVEVVALAFREFLDISFEKIIWQGFNQVEFLHWKTNIKPHGDGLMIVSGNFLICVVKVSIRSNRKSDSGWSVHVDDGGVLKKTLRTLPKREDFCK